MTEEELERMKAEYFAKGGSVTKGEPTEYNRIVSDTSRLKYWGEDGEDKESKHRVMEEGLTLFTPDPMTRNNYGGIEDKDSYDED
jgi:hypothetical protein